MSAFRVDVIARTRIATTLACALLLLSACGEGSGDTGSTGTPPASPSSPTTPTTPTTPSTPATNTAPVISGTPVTTATVGTAWQFQPTASDADSDALSFQITGKPAWATFSTATGMLSGTPASGNVGAQAATVITVSDGKASTSLAAFTITVQAAAASNRAPTISGSPPASGQAGQAYQFTPTASDPDGDALTFSIANKPDWATFSTSTGALSGTPSAAGTHAGITITVSDGKTTASLPAFTLTIAAASSGSVPPAVACSSPMTGTHATYNVGGGVNAHAELSTVPWLSLVAGDVVNIYYRAQPYRTRIALRAQGTAQNPVIINGVTDSSCNRPVISGDSASNSQDQASGYHTSNSGTDGLANILIWWGSGHYGAKPSFITLQNLAITGGNSGIYAVTADDLTVQNTDIYGVNGWGVFVNSKNNSTVETSYRVTIRNNRIYDNGVYGSFLFHNLYIQAYRALYEGNYIGQLRAGAIGSSLKDRSSGTIIRYNQIVAAARAIDLVETEENMGVVGQDPQYHDAWVYGNVIINDDTSNTVAGSGSLIHWGYDNTPANARHGTLYFFQNTIASNVTRNAWYALFDQESSNSAVDPHNTVELRNNIIWNRGTVPMKMAETKGNINVVGANWISSGWGNGDPNGNSVAVNVSGNLIQGTDPGLDASYRPVGGSPVINASAGVNASSVGFEFKSPVGTQARATTQDLGAREH